MGQGRQAKVLSDKQFAAVWNLVETSRHPARNRVILLLSFKAGLRAKEIATLRWRHVCDAEGEIGDSINIENIGSKGSSGGRTIPLNSVLADCLFELRNAAGLKNYKPATGAAVVYVDSMGTPPGMDTPVIITERNKTGVAAQVIVNTFGRWFRDLGFEGASSHSGRRTFITRAAKGIVAAGGSLRDVQQLAGHSSLQTTQRYIEGSTDAKKRIVDLV